MASLTRVAKSREARADERREEFETRVLQALEDLMSDGTPYTELAVRRIASASRVARSTFYRHFPDKSRLLIRMADLATANLFGAAEHFWHTEHVDVWESAVGAMRQMIAEFRTHRPLLLALTEVSAYDPEVGRYWRARVQGFMGIVCQRLDAEQRDGRIDTPLDVNGTAILLTSMVERSITTAFIDQSLIDDEELAQALGRAICLVVYGKL